MAGAGKHATRLIAAWISIAFGTITRALPLPLSRAFTIALARIAYYVVPRIRKVGLANLDLAYGATLSRGEKKRILKASVRSVAVVAAELSRTPLLRSGGSRRFVDMEGLEHVDTSRGAVCIAAHLGNWEWMAAAIVDAGFQVAEVVRPFDAPALNRYIDGLRRSGGVRTIPKDDAGRELMRLFNENWIVGMLVDQSPRENAAPVTFFGAPCWATIGPAIVALRTKAPIHPVSMTRNEDGRYTLRFYPALDIKPTGDFRHDLLAVTQQCQGAVESIIRRYPDQWLWFHRRWKQRPRLSAEWAARSRNSASGKR